jgi:hypothetical protein
VVETLGFGRLSLLFAPLVSVTCFVVPLVLVGDGRCIGMMLEVAKS